MNALEKNETWELVPLPTSKKTIGCHWIYTVKHNSDRPMSIYKARLVAKGYMKTFGIDYDEAFAPITKINTISVLLSLSANLNWALKPFDIKNAFLHRVLNVEVYMSFPPGYETTPVTNVVCKLKKSLYGLKNLHMNCLRGLDNPCIAWDTNKEILIILCSLGIKSAR